MSLLDELIGAQVRRTPDAVAVTDAERRLTYGDLHARSGRLAGALVAAGVRPDEPVAVIVDRGVDLAVAVLGILRAGGAYVPVESQTPAPRVRTVLEQARVRVCVADAALRERLSVPGLTVLAPGAPGPVPAPAGSVPDASGPDAPGPAAPPAAADRHPQQLCAVYFTSGSTGVPKGVACTHAGWANRIAWMQRRHGLRPGETVLHKTTLTFDDAAVELLWPLTVGGRVAMLAPGAHRDPRAIIDAAVAWRAVHLQFVPSMLDLFLDELTGDDLAALGSLRSVLCSGEALRPALVARFLDRFGERVSLDNTWGATEVSIDSTYHVCGPADTRAGGGSVCVGVAMTGNTVQVLDGAHRPVADGDLGELCIGGVGLARGYLGDPRRTAAVFVPDPAGTGARMYRTGDRGYRRADGSLMFVDRVDHQVKIRGVRVELGEVEAALRDHPDVRHAAVVAVDTGTGDKQLAGYIVADPGAAGPVRSYLREVLPSYAVPTFLTVLERLPTHPNGKLDRLALAALPREVQGAGDAGPYLAPRTITEETVAEIWAGVLGVDQVSVDQDFFAAGGHSLLAVRMLSRLRQAFVLDLPLKIIFENPTVAALAARLEELVMADIEAGTQKVER